MKSKKSSLASLFVISLFFLICPSSNAQVLDQTTPAKGYLSFISAQSSGDINLFNKTIVASKIRPIKSEMELKLFHAMAAMSAKNIKIVSEKINGNQATLTTTGFIPMCNGNAKGTVKMVKESGVWKVDIEKYQTTSKDKYGSGTCSVGFGEK